MDGLTKAFAESERSYFSAKSNVGRATEAMMARGPGGAQVTPPDMARAAEQLRHFTGWVYASIRPIAQKIAGQPIRVGLKNARPLGVKSANNKPEPLQSHPLLDLLEDPNPLGVAWGLMFVTVASLELTGRQLWWLPDKAAIWPIPSSWLVGFNGTSKWESFTIRPPTSGEAFDLPADDCCYFSYPSPSDPHGAYSPLQAAAGAVDADESIQTSQAAAFRQGLNPQHAVIVGKQPHPDVPGGVRPALTNSQQRQIIAAIRKRYSGVARHGEPLILDALIEDVKKLSHSPEEMDWLNSGESMKRRIMQTFGTNPIIAGQIEGANRASSLAAEDHFTQYTLNPKIELLSQTMSAWLGPLFDGVQVWIEPAVVHDIETELRKMDMAARHGVLTADELRHFCGLAKDKNFSGVLVGGKDMATTGLIERGLSEMIQNGLAAHEADQIVNQAKSYGLLPAGRNGRARITQ